MNKPHDIRKRGAWPGREMIGSLCCERMEEKALQLLNKCLKTSSSQVKGCWSLEFALKSLKEDRVLSVFAWHRRWISDILFVIRSVFCDHFTIVLLLVCLLWVPLHSFSFSPLFVPTWHEMRDDCDTSTSKIWFLLRFPSQWPRWPDRSWAAIKLMRYEADYRREIATRARLRRGVRHAPSFAHTSDLLAGMRPPQPSMPRTKNVAESF